MKTNSNLLFIQYPSGGYGFYLARLINRYVPGVVKVTDPFKFDALGTSHLLPLVYGHIHFNQNKILDITSANHIYHDSILQDNLVLIPYCPGINDDMILDTLNYYPNCKIVRLCYNDSTWPLVFFNAIVKAKRGDVNKDILFDSEQFGSDADWAKRENFSLLFKCHNLRQQWKPVIDKRVLNIDVLSLLIDTKTVIKDISKFLHQQLNISENDLENKHQEFLSANPATLLHLKILKILENLNIYQDLSWINDLYWQAVVNFYIEEQYDITIKVNEYPNWFNNTLDCVSLIRSNKNFVR